jgi:hypothetical protein
MVRYTRSSSHSMVGKRYRLADPALAIMNQDGQRFRMTIPPGGVVEVVAGPLNEDWLLEVIWKEKALTMFAIDVREHAELVDGAGN